MSTGPRAASQAGPLSSRAIHALRRWIVHANRGEFHQRRSSDQDLQAECLNLVTNGVLTWNAVYTDAARSQLASQGQPIDDEHLAHLSPAMHEHINVHGHYDFSALQPLPPGSLRALRTPTSPISHG